MSSASLAVPRHAHPDAARIAALSGAIAINLVALVAVLRPMAPQWVEQVQQLTQTQVRWITPPPKAPDPPAIKMEKIAPPKTVPHTQVAPPVTPPVVTLNDQGSIAAPPVTPTVEPAAEPTTGDAPIEATLAYRAVPLSYPTQALRTHMQGTVVLRVLVDEQGVPQEVNIEQSSGYALLDRSAHDQVLRGWKFQPAMVNGRAVRAWARVPVTFNLNQL
ncbi:energy transducer TonB [Dyella solisilvae]|uniref:Energy transducer TonB n=1 Tax=Dyella solisilvae TaxID=1920168 RepID=A0A370KDL5_9GAMM|nr:energy transducer TonB [Dyella solisilvae]RDJ00528.1 energy transducer TonB [Dyella solisilvae]